MVKLGTICRFQSGGTPAKGIIEYYNGTIPWVTTVALNGGKINEEDAVEWITEKAIRESAAKVVPANSILVGTRVGVGKVAVNAVAMSTSQDVIALLDIDESRWNKDYICKFLQGKSSFLNAQARGATIKGIKIDVLSSLELPEISLSEQNRISQTIDAVKRIIEYRQQEFSALDDLIKARFVEMFGDPCNNPMGHINMTVKEAVDRGYIDKPLDGNHGEKHPKASEYVESGVPFVMANNLVNGIVDYEHCSKIKRERADKLDKGFAHDGDVLITHKGTIGRTAIVHTELDYIMLTPQVTYYRPVKGIIASYLKSYFDTDYCQEEMKKLAASGGSTRAYVGITNQTQLQLLIPRVELQKQFAGFVNQADKSKAAIQKALDEAQLLFDSLMQEYFG